MRVRQQDRQTGADRRRARQHVGERRPGREEGSRNPVHLPDPVRGGTPATASAVRGQLGGEHGLVRVAGQVLLQRRGHYGHVGRRVQQRPKNAGQPVDVNTERAGWPVEQLQFRFDGRCAFGSDEEPEKPVIQLQPVTCFASCCRYANAFLDQSILTLSRRPLRVLIARLLMRSRLIYKRAADTTARDRVPDSDLTCGPAR